MTVRDRWPRHGALLAAALGILLLKLLYLALTPVRGLAMTTWIIDDTFINMQVARNIALGHGFTFDGIHPTNGAPFLWTYLTSLNHLIFPLWTAVKATFMESAFFGVLAAMGCYAIAWTLTRSKMAAWLAFLLAALTANACLEAMNGMDTALFTFLTVAGVAAYLGIGTARVRNRFLAGCIGGLPVGLAILTRGDGLFIAMAIGLCLLADAWRQRKQPRPALQYLAGFCVASGACLAVLMVWGIVHAGSPFPANQVGRREIALQWHGATNGISLPKYFKVVGWNIFQLEQLMTVAGGSTLLLLASLLFLSGKPATRTFAAVTGLYCALFLGTLVAYQWYFPDLHGLRYINPSIHLLLIALAVLLATLFEGKWRGLALALITAAVLALSWYGFVTALRRIGWMNDGLTWTGFATESQQARFWDFYEWTNAHIPKGSVIGVRDNGRFALFTGLPVQDLSGVIDPTVSRKLREGGAALSAYLRQGHVEYLWIPSLDQREDPLYQELHQYLTLEPVPGAPTSIWQENLYHIHWNPVP